MNVPSAGLAVLSNRVACPDDVAALTLRPLVRPSLPFHPPLNEYP